MKEFFLIGIVLGLFLLGMAIALNSGREERRTGRRFSLLMFDVWALLLRVAAYVAGLLAVQRAIGSPSLLDW